MAVHFSNETVDFLLNDESLMKKWISEVIKRHGKTLGKISYRFCSDDFIFDVNVKFLNHDTYTDIITFDYVSGNVVSGDILISIDRVGENALQLGVPFDRELHRVIIHGVLHLLGFKDKSDADAAQMRAKEEESLAMLDAMKK
ncbi:MAG: rRNA maturation RNase YbeY [Bacteroidales bacterium]|nr:rRNA maturation RNase YbeY [Bacteroidales bacterium]